jgi:protein involved in polysaccharide export with SLBB domain
VPFATPIVEISGPVRRPGHYELVASKDLAELLELAGGFTSEANRALPLRLLRLNDRQQLATTELPFTGEVAPNLALHDADQIVVRSREELQRTVLIIGAVVGADPLDHATTSRRVPFVDGDTVLSLIERVGGIKAPGDLRRSYISRSRPDREPELIPLDLEALLVRRDFSVDRPVQMNDTIVVPPMIYSVLVEIDTDGHTHPFRAGMKPTPGDAILVPERNFSRGEIAQLILAGAGIVLSGIAVTIAASR